MEAILKSINAVTGVKGCFICDGDGQVLASALPDFFDESNLSIVGRTMTQTIAGFKIIHRRKVGDIEMVYDKSRLITKSLAEGCLCILTVRNISVPLLNLTANIAAKKLSALVAERKEKIQKEDIKQAAWDSNAQLLNEEVRSIISSARGKGVVLRASGDTAVRMHCQNAGQFAPHLDDEVLDMVGLEKQSAQIDQVLNELGYSPERSFNVLYGRQRLRFIHPEKRLGIEVFLDEMNMYHHLKLSHRLDLDENTISLADLLLWKLQFIEPDEGILRTIFTIVHDHELGQPGESEKIDMARILELCSSDWGWFKTVTINLEKCITWAEMIFADKAKDFQECAQRMLQIINEAPKSGGWHLRARIGENVRWYEIPE